MARDLEAVRITFKRRITSEDLIFRDASGTKVSLDTGRLLSTHRAIRAVPKRRLKA